MVWEGRRRRGVHCFFWVWSIGFFGEDRGSTVVFFFVQVVFLIHKCFLWFAGVLWFTGVFLWFTGVFLVGSQVFFWWVHKCFFGVFTSVCTCSHMCLFCVVFTHVFVFLLCSHMFVCFGDDSHQLRCASFTSP